MVFLSRRDVLRASWKHETYQIQERRTRILNTDAVFLAAFSWFVVVALSTATKRWKSQNASVFGRPNLSRIHARGTRSDLKLTVVSGTPVTFVNALCTPAQHIYDKTRMATKFRNAALLGQIHSIVCNIFVFLYLFRVWFSPNNILSNTLSRGAKKRAAAA